MYNVVYSTLKIEKQCNKDLWHFFFFKNTKSKLHLVYHSSEILRCEVNLIVYVYLKKFFKICLISLLVHYTNLQYLCKLKPQSWFLPFHHSQHRQRPNIYTFFNFMRRSPWHFRYSNHSPYMIFVARKKIMLAEIYVMQVLH